MAATVSLAGSFFHGLSEDEVQTISADLPIRQFPAGSVVLAEGDILREVYVIQSGSADVYVSDRRSALHRINTVGAGDSIGEMSLLTGQPASATVRASTDVRVLALNEHAFQTLLTTYPAVSRNVGIMLAQRLARSNRRGLPDHPSRVTVLRRRGTPPELGYALAASIAWHSRQPTLFLHVSPAPPDEIVQHAQQRPASPTGGRTADGGVVVIASEPAGPYSPEELPRTIERFRDRFSHIVFEADPESPPPANDAAIVDLTGGETRSFPAGRYTLVGWQEAAYRPGPGPNGVIPIPALTDQDAGQLAAGLLPARGAAGRALGWVARDLAGLKVGLVLGAGSIKGYAHIGVLQTLDRHGIPVDAIAGASIGAAVSSAVAVGFSAASCAKILERIGASAFKLTIPTAALLSSNGLRDGVRRIARDRRIEETRIPLAVIAADIVTGREVVFREGLIWPAVLASMSIPGIYPPVKIGAHTLVDGGVLNPVPTDVATELGANTVIAVKLSNRALLPPLGVESVPPAGRNPSVIQTIQRSIEMMQGKITTEAAAAATIQIEPEFGDLTGWGLRTFTDGARFIDAGISAAEAALPRIASALPWVNPVTE